MQIQPKRTYFDEAYMRCLPTIWLSLVASVLIAGFAHAAPHKELAPLPEEALQAVRVGQHSRNDVLAEALEHHLHETRALLERTRKTATRLSTAGTAVDDEIASRRSESAAKRRQMLDLRNEVFARLDASIQADESRGDSRSATEKRALRRQLGTRFADLDSDLAALQNASRGNFEARSRQAANRVEGWLAARPVAPLAPPNWTQAQPQPMVELPAAAEPPRFVLDTLWLLRHHFAAAGGQMQVALRTTPSEASACGYNTADLASTPEAPKNHADIQALVQQLDHNPVRLFEWVRQNVAYEPYFGSLKGGLGALWSHSGGATDQASLLVALLRAANIPARYVRGTVSVLDASPKGADGRGPRWIGAKSYQAAAQMLANNGNPAAGSGTNSISLAHVWVEACLPYAAYRGAALDDSGHRWVPLDASYKDHRYQAGVGVDSTFDFNYTAWLASRIDAQGRYRLPQEAFEDQVEAHAKTKAPNYANTTLEDVPYKSEIKRQRFDILPIVPPYEVIKYDSWSGVAGESAETTALPDRHRHRLQVSVRNKSSTADPVAGNLLLQKTFSLAEVALARLTLSFKGATATDQSAFDAWFNAVDPAANPTCAATANMAPSLKVSGTEQAPEAGSGSTPLCSTDNVMQLKVTVAELPTNAGVLSQTYFTNIGAANLHALHAYAWHTSDTYLAKRSEQLLAAVRANSSDPNADRDGIEGEFLNLAASKYSRYFADASRRAGELFGESGTVGISLGLTSAQVKVNYLFDLPYGLYRKGFLIDWPGGVYTGSRLDTPSTTDKRAFKLAGFAGSAYEAYIWQESAKLDAISTTRGLQFAKEQGIEILQINNATDWSNQKCKLTNTCADTALNTNPAGTLYSASHVSQIETSYVNQGFKLTLPRRLIQYPDSTGWKGATFYGEKFTSGASSASFPINAYSGGMTIDPPAADSDGSSPGGETPDGSASGGYAQGSATGSLYNPSLGTGIVADPYAPSFAQLSGLNGYQTALGFGSGSSVSGDPVNMVTGNLIHSERDIAIKGRGGLPLVFERWYNSQAAKDGPLGYGWTHSFNHRLRFYGVESGVAKVAWIDGTGGERYFATANHSSGNIATGATFSGSAGITATLERLADGTYRITERSGMQYRFENITASATDSGQKARLLSITDKNGNPLTLSYAPLGGCPGTDVCKVSDGLNRALTFTYSNARLSQISDWSGRSWQYSYDASGDLVTFKNPLAVSGSQPAVTYQYYTTLDSPKLAHALKQYQLPRGNGMKFEYYANGRVFRHTPFASAGRLKEDHATSFAWAEFRREARQIDALGNERRFLFDKHGNPISITDEAGAETTYSYDATAGRTHLRLSKTDPQGMTTNYAYDTVGNLTDLTLPSGRTLQYRDHTAYGQPQRTKDADGRWTLNRYDSLGKLTDRIATRVGVVPVANSRPANSDILAWTQFAADSVGNPLKTRRLRDWTGAVLGDAASGVGPSIETAWDANQLNPINLTRRGDKDGTPATLETDVYSDFVHDNLGRMTRGPDQNWYPADSAFDALDRPIKSPDGRGHQWDTVYDANGNPLMVGLTINGSYLDGHYAAWDDLDRLERRVDYAGNAVLNSYNPLGHLTSVTGPDGYTLGFERDPLGRVTGAYNEEGHRVSLARDADGKPRSVTDPNHLTTSYDYHHGAEDGRLKRTTLPTVAGQTQGRAVEIAAYDGAGRPTSIDVFAADGSVRDSYNFFDELGRLTRAVGPPVSATDPSRPVTCLVYTVLGDTKEIWAGGTTDTVSSTCNLADASLKKQLARTYDDFGRKLTETDANGNTWRWTWNAHNQLVSSQTPTQLAAGQSTTYAWGSKGAPGETQGQLKQRSVPGAQTVAYTRDALGLVTKAETRTGSNQTVVAYAYTYDPAQRLRTVTDARGSNSVAKMLTYTWTPGGRLARIEDSDGHSTSLSYDAVGRLASLAAPNGENIAFVWDAGGRLVEQRLNSGQRTTQSWFEDGGLKQKQNLFNTTVLSSHLYTIDQQGRRAGQTETINTSTKTWSYLYDNLDRLTSASDGTAETTSYDIYGNRRSKTTGATTTAYLYDLAHQLSEVRSGSDTGPLTGAAVHDADGHMTKLCEVSSGGTVTKTANDCTASGTGATTLALVWNALDHLNTATRTGTGAVTESYAYDDSGRRITKVGAGGTAHYLYDGADIHAEWANAMVGMPQAVYAHGAGTDEPLLRLTGSTNSPSATQAAYLQDGLGSVVGTTNITGTLTASQRFDAWGNRTAATGSVPQYGYTGREPDQTGLTFYRARYYHAGIGRFMSRDPAGMADAVSPYAYVRNNPVNLIDPMGFMATDPVKLADASGSQSYWGIAADIGVGFTPAGVVADVYSAATGKTAFGGQELSGWERALGLIPGVSEGMAVFRGGVKGAGAVSSTAGRIVTNPVPLTMARVIPEGVPATTLGRPGAADVFVTAADDITGMNASQLANRLGIPQSLTGFRVFEFPTPQSGVASPVFRTDPGFIGGGLTSGGAREFVIPNGPIPPSAVIRTVP